MTNEEKEDRALKMLAIIAGVTNRNIDEAIEITQTMLNGLRQTKDNK